MEETRIQRDLRQVVNKYGDVKFSTFELNFVEMAKSCLYRIEDLQRENEQLKNGRETIIAQAEAIGGRGMSEKNTEKLLRLVRENPELPIVPFVWYEVCEDDHGYWMSSFERCTVEEYAIYDESYFTDRDDLKEAYYDNNEDFFEGLTADEAEKLLEKKTGHWWTKAIIVYIGLPDKEK